MTSFSHRVALRWRRYGHKHRNKVAFLFATSGLAVGASSYRRRWRSNQVQELALAKDALQAPLLENLVLNATRAGLMRPSTPESQSVVEELDKIRQWHQDRGFRGGLVLRETTKQLFVESDIQSEGGNVFYPTNPPQRECYYLYYEIRSNGEIRQQIFCRGATLREDVLTCLQFWWSWDEELQCRFHNGFLSHATRVLADVEHLLAPPSDPRATIELCGHSLGGATAFIVAMKLKRRGYNVTRVTSIGAPRICHKDDLEVLSKQLPPVSIRIEDDSDLVPFLPPYGAHLGDKLWFVREGGDASPVPRYVPLQDVPTWVDSVWANLRVLETIINMNERHRMPNYVSQLSHLAEDVNMNEPIQGDQLEQDINKKEPLQTEKN